MCEIPAQSSHLEKISVSKGKKNDETTLTRTKARAKMAKDDGGDVMLMYDVMMMMMMMMVMMMTMMMCCLLRHFITEWCKTHGHNSNVTI